MSLPCIEGDNSWYTTSAMFIPVCHVDVTTETEVAVFVSAPYESSLQTMLPDGWGESHKSNTSPWLTSSLKVFSYNKTMEEIRFPLETCKQKIGLDTLCKRWL